MKPPDLNWETFCKRGRYSIDNQRRSVEHCMGPDGIVRGHYSDFKLDPTLPEKSAVFPVHHRSESGEMVVDARFVVDMMSVLSETEFWMAVEHFFSVGREEGRIGAGNPQRLPSGWKPKINY